MSQIFDTFVQCIRCTDNSIGYVPRLCDQVQLGSSYPGIRIVKNFGCYTPQVELGEYKLTREFYFASEAGGRVG